MQFVIFGEEVVQQIPPADSSVTLLNIMQFVISPSADQSLTPPAKRAVFEYIEQFRMVNGKEEEE